MKTRILAILALGGLFLAGCATSDTEASRSLTDIIRAERGETAQTPETCTVPDGMVGKPHTEIQNLKLKSPVRVIYPGDAVPNDRIINRLNFKLDKNGVIKSITCG